MSELTLPIIVVIGNGMVGYKFCEKLVSRSNPFQIVVFGEETRVAYDRVHLSAYFDGKTAEDLQLSASLTGISDSSYYTSFGRSGFAGSTGPIRPCIP